MMDLKIEFVDGQTKLPFRATEGSVGYDLFSNEKVVISPHTSHRVKLGIKVEFSDDYFLLITARSSIDKKKLILSNGVGIIDSDYRGELMASFRNISDHDINIEKGERIVQMIVMPKIAPVNLIVGNVNETSRGACGFGSTGT